MWKGGREMVERWKGDGGKADGGGLGEWRGHSRPLRGSILVGAMYPALPAVAARTGIVTASDLPGPTLPGRSGQPGAEETRGMRLAGAMVINQY